MCREFGNHWVEYRDPIDLMDCSSNMEIGLPWYQKGTDNNQTDDLMGHLMVGLEKIIALASMRYIVDLDVYGLHPRDEKAFNDFLNEC